MVCGGEITVLLAQNYGTAVCLVLQLRTWFVHIMQISILGFEHFLDRKHRTCTLMAIRIRLVQSGSYDVFSVRVRTLTNNDATDEAIKNLTTTFASLNLRNVKLVDSRGFSVKIFSLSPREDLPVQRTRELGFWDLLMGSLRCCVIWAWAEFPPNPFSRHQANHTLSNSVSSTSSSNCLESILPRTIS